MMILMPGCNCCGGGTWGCPAESITVTLTDLPQGDTGVDNYVTSNEGSFHLKKIFETVPEPTTRDFVCRWEYKDIASGGVPSDYIVLRITLEHWTREDRFGNFTEELRLYVEMDGGELWWFKAGTTVDPQNYTFTNSDLTFNAWYPSQPAGMQAVASAYDPASRDQCDGYLPCENWRDAATPEETCPPIMTVTDAMDTTNYCGEPATVFQQSVPGSSPAKYIKFIQGGTDSLNLTLPSDWVYTWAYGTHTIEWGGGTHSLGWGGYDNVDAYVSPDQPPNSSCGGPAWNPYFFYSEGWVSVFSGVTVTLDYSAGGGSISVFDCVAIAQANLVNSWTPFPGWSSPINYPSRRIVLKIALLYERGTGSGTAIDILSGGSFAFVSDGTLGEDAYVVGSFSTFTESDVSMATRICPISSGGTADPQYGYTFTLEQG